MELFELIQTLNRAHGPSGDEGEIREVIRALAEPYADEITADTMGRLIVHRRGKGNFRHCFILFLYLLQQ